MKITRNMQQESIQHNNRNILSQRNPKDYISTPSKRKDNSKDYTRTQYGRVVRKPDRLTYS